jgi:predicted nucleic acid-binding protein
MLNLLICAKFPDVYLKLAKENGLIASIKPFIGIIHKSGIHIGKPLIQKALLLADE